jgi:cobalt-zinc-cadmium efflux system membrane fusion protein
MYLPAGYILRKLGVAIVVLVIVGTVAATIPLVGRLVAGGPPSGQGETPSEGAANLSAALVAGEPDTVRLPADVAKKVGMRAVPVEPAGEPRAVELSGSLAFDTDHLARVHTRFPGEVVEISPVLAVAEGPGQAASVARPVRFGDHVEKGQLMAVVYCKDLGEKKSELVDALSALRTDKEQYDKLNEYKGDIPEVSLRAARRTVEADLNAAARAERTLRVWRLSDDEIQAIKDEAARILERQGKRDTAKEKVWARVEVRAPFDGVVVEKNVAVGDIVDTTNDLFKVANLDRLTVWAHAYEEDLPALQAVKKQHQGRIPWTVRLGSDPEASPLRGTIQEIGFVVDPTQHTVLVMGQVDNPRGELRAGQFVTATVQVPPAPDAVTIPMAALVEDGRESIVFVQPDPQEFRYELRRVAVTRRGQGKAEVRSKLTPREVGRGLNPLRPRERVLVTGAVELKAALEDLASAGKK